MKSFIVFTLFYIKEITSNSYLRKLEKLILKLYILFSIYLFIILYNKDNNYTEYYCFYILVDSLYFVFYNVMYIKDNDRYTLLN